VGHDPEEPGSVSPQSGARAHDEPLNRDQLIAKAKFICGRIIDGDMAAYDGARIIWNECHYQNMPSDHTFDPFVYWADEYESADTDDRRQYCEDAVRQSAHAFLGSGR
jgi:hypothetical protein